MVIAVRDRGVIMDRLINYTDILLRVPPLFLMDILMRLEYDIPSDSLKSAADDNINSLNDFVTQHEFVTPNDSLVIKTVLIYLLKLFISTSGCLFALGVFLLPKVYLVNVYKFLGSIGIMFISYWANVSTMKAVIAARENNYEINPRTSILHSVLSLDLQGVLDWNEAALAIVKNYLVQSTMGLVFQHIELAPTNRLIQLLTMPAFMAPSVLAMLPVPDYMLHHSPVFAALLPLGKIKMTFWSSAVQVGNNIVQGYRYARQFVSDVGLTALLENEWVRLRVPTVLRTFWMLRVAEHSFSALSKCFFLKEQEVDSSKCSSETLMALPRELLVTGCETQTAVLGMTSVISFLCHYVGSFFQWILLTEDEDDRSIGTVSAILFFILALQTGLTGLDPEKRFIRLCRNFCLLFTAILHFIHNIVNPLLMSLSASHNPARHRHVRALSVCAFLVIFPVALLIYLWSQHTMSTWLLAVSAFSVEVIVKVIVSLMIYSLFLVDAYRSTFWESLDDYVYYIRAFGNTVEFCFGIFLFFNGAWILVFESGGAIRAIMMCIHAYFNIWCEARAGWSVFIKRRTAVKKINSLPEATEEQLEKLDDVCAICYQEMSSAKITRCRHFFHGVCLRKWLYVQDRCPLCHEILHLVEDDYGLAADSDIEFNVANEQFDAAAGFGEQEMPN
ncbi:protein TRC8 homolog [Neocloeon triangulifer]|uniref:protein TRC8 homolog n=1 Tax=Neocloeon triangulifer TaxID=2078957 RepID=UPI00286F7CFE|nr:protein TRC8 homolog [Neocloeon triangulifer]